MKKRKLLTLILAGALLGVNLNINAVQKRTQPDNPSGQSRRQEKRPRTERREAQTVLTQRTLQKLQILDQNLRDFLQEFIALSRHANDDGIRSLLETKVDTINIGVGILTEILNKTTGRHLIQFLEETNNIFSEIGDVLIKSAHYGANPGVINPLLAKSENIKRLISEIIRIQNSAPIIEDLNEDQGSVPQQQAPMQQDDSGFDSSDDEADASVPLERQQTFTEAEEIRRRQEAARGQQAEEFNLLMERLKVAINKLNESKLDADFQDVTLALAVVKQNPEYIRRKASLRRVDLEKIRRGEEKDLSFADLRNLDLTRFDLSGSILIGANLSGANLTETNLENSIICDSDLSNATLNATKFSKSKIINSDFSYSIFNNVKPDHVLILNETKFVGAKFIGESIFQECVIKKSSFVNAIFNNFQFHLCTIEDTNMRHINAEVISFTATNLTKIDFTLAKIKGLLIFGAKVIGDQLDFKYATIKKGCVLGEVILNYRGKEIVRTEGITEEVDSATPRKVAYIPSIAFVGAGVNSALIALGATVLAPGVVGGILLGSCVIGCSELPMKYIYEKIEDWNKWHRINNINSILRNSNFHASKFEDVYFSNIKFSDCSNFSDIKMALGCLFENVIGSDPLSTGLAYKGIEKFMSKGARINNQTIRFPWKRRETCDGEEVIFMSYEPKIDNNFTFIWEKTKYLPYIQEFSKAFVEGVISGAFKPTTAQNE